jgi:polyphosphate kinase 2
LTGGRGTVKAPAWRGCVYNRADAEEQMAKKSSGPNRKQGTDKAASGTAAPGSSNGAPVDAESRPKKLSRKKFDKELQKLQRELVIMQEYVKAKGPKIVVIFEGRDAAGKGGVIKRIAERTNPRICRVVALPAPTEREKTQWYFQRYVAHLPAAGEIVLFDRSWYNRAGVERVMGFCTEEEYQEFMRSCPEFERMLVRSGIQLIKYWFSVSDEEQERRFQARVHDPMRRWKLSPMDLESRARWVEYSRSKDEMFRYTDVKHAPWYVVDADDKRRARLNCIAHLLSLIDYEDLTPPPLELPVRGPDDGYVRPPLDEQTFVPRVY